MLPCLPHLPRLQNFRSTINVLLEGTPDDLDVEALKRELSSVKDDEGLPLVSNVHDLHVWTVDGGEPLLTAHMNATDVNLALKKAHEVCQARGINHATLQVESGAGCSSGKCCH